MNSSISGKKYELDIFNIVKNCLLNNIKFNTQDKKEPSAYNKFIKEQMTLHKNDVYNPKDRMRKAIEEWKKQKKEQMAFLKNDDILIDSAIKEQKKEPSAYNKFIKEQMTLLKNDGYNPKDRMRKATEEWKKQKNIKIKI